MIIALWEPEIPGNTGSIGRLCAANNIPLWILGKPAFEMSDKAAQRAGLDYWDQLDWRMWHDPQEFIDEHHSRCLFFTKRASKLVVDHVFTQDQILVFGPETRGLDASLLQTYFPQTVRIPQLNNNVRSINLAQSVAVGLYLGLAQFHSRGAEVNKPHWIL